MTDHPGNQDAPVRRNTAPCGGKTTPESAAAIAPQATMFASGIAPPVS